VLRNTVSICAGEREQCKNLDMPRMWRRVFGKAQLNAIETYELANSILGTGSSQRCGGEEECLRKMQGAGRVREALP
jgi:hypothetical protein